MDRMFNCIEKIYPNIDQISINKLDLTRKKIKSKIYMSVFNILWDIEYKNRLTGWL